MVRETDDVKDFVDSLFLRWRNAGTQRFEERSGAGQRQFQVLEHIQMFEHGRFLKFPANTDAHDFRFGHFEEVDLAAKPGRSGTRSSFAGDDVHHGRLACTVRADNAEQLTGIHMKSEFVERPKAIEAHGQLSQA